MEELTISHEGLDVLFYLDGTSLRHLGIFPQKMADALRAQQHDAAWLSGLVETELLCTGEDQDEHHGLRLVGGNPGRRLIFEGMAEAMDGADRKVVLSYTDALLGLKVESHYKLIAGQPVIRRWVCIKNTSAEPVGIDHLFSAVVNGIGLGGERDWSEKMRLHVPHSTWCGEAQWRSGRLSDFGLHRHNTLDYGIACIPVSQTGSWSSLNYQPMGMLEDLEDGVVWYWQIEHNGSWHWEVGRSAQGSIYLSVGGPNEEKNHCWKNLQPGETFETVPVAIGVAEGNWQDAVEHLISYRRAACLRPHSDNRELPVIFNDYMNCLFADPTTEKELPLIDAAGKIGCEYFMIDAGWYSALGEDWWPTVGMWQPSPDRFPGGLAEVMGAIRAHGMVPGLWVEIEVVGASGPMKNKPDSWFMMRHGKRVIDHGRYLLDYRNPEVRAYADEVVDRLVNDYGIGYLKNDFNVTAKTGTETDADSFGDGLLQHNRAFLSWMDAVARRHPNLVFENCASGGLRMDYASLSRCQVQSSSDQTNYRYYPPVLSGAMAACVPEQLAVWSYPPAEADEEEIAFNMINALLCRIHLSGGVAKLPPEKLKYVEQAISTYKRYRRDIPNMIPFWPTGMITLSDGARWHTLGLRHKSQQRILLAVWRLQGEDVPDSFTIPLPLLAGRQVKVELLYPADLPCKFHFEPAAASLGVEMDRAWTARLFEIRYA